MYQTFRIEKSSTCIERIDFAEVILYWSAKVNYVYENDLKRLSKERY